MCLVHSWSIALVAICIAAWLSQNMRAGAGEEIWRSRSNWWIRTSSLVVADKALYSASAEDLDRVLCFFVFQDTKESPRKTQNPVIDFLVPRQEPQSASAKAWSWKEDWAENKRPCPGVALIYSSRWCTALRWGCLGWETIDLTCEPQKWCRVWKLLSITGDQWVSYMKKHQQEVPLRMSINESWDPWV